MTELEEHKQAMIERLRQFHKTRSDFPLQEFINAVNDAATHQGLSDLDQCLDTWKYGY